MFDTPHSHLVNDSIRKQPAASSLVNRYLSAAGHYLNRTRSFHVPSALPNNNKTFIPTTTIGCNDPHVTGQYLLTYNRDLAPSLAASMQNLSPSANLPILPANLECQQPCDANPMPSDKPHGLVNTLRRSLRKSRERFYNKRSSTMKSCQSLNNYDVNSPDDPSSPTPICMTPVLLSRHPYSTIGRGTIHSPSINRASKTNETRAPPPEKATDIR